jgi:hypothetical protein
MGVLLFVGRHMPYQYYVLHNQRPLEVVFPFVIFYSIVIVFWEQCVFREKGRRVRKHMRRPLLEIPNMSMDVLIRR